MNKEESKIGDSQIIIYETSDGNTQLAVQLENESVCLSLNQMLTLFDRDKSLISRYIRNIYKEQELEEQATVQNENGREIVRQIEYYNLDVIISVGYRVKSQRGTQFRIWANSVLKEYLIKGYAIKQNAKNEQLEDLKKTVKLLSNVIDSKSLSADEATGLLRVITDYTYVFDTLERYDFQQIKIENTTTEEKDVVNLINKNN